LKNLSNKTLQIIPNDSISLKYLELSKNKKDRYTIAEEEANINPSPKKYLELSLLFYNNNMFLKCIDACNKALKLNPNYAEAYNNICSSYSSMQQYEKAIKACKKALELKADFTLAINNLNYAKAQLKIKNNE